MTEQVRCVNLDWLEIFVNEGGTPHDEEYFTRAGYIVQPREYGTRIYHQMFTLHDHDGNPLLEVRRLPKNPLMPTGASHIRLVNASCYRNDAADFLRSFLIQHDYLFERVSRADICLDLVKFDDNTLPRIFMQRYMRGKFSKLNQSNIHSHGSDRWTGRVWNSVSWGSPSSPISTKFYNKTLELYDPLTNSYAKPHIRWAWLNAGLIDDWNRCTLNGETQEIWRIEFSIKSAVKNWVTIELNGNSKNYYSIHNTLDMYDSREKLLTMFAALSQHYFHFKRYMMGVRKDKCPDRRLFSWHSKQNVVIPEHPDMISSRLPDSQLLKLIKMLRNYLDAGATFETREPANLLLQKLQQSAANQQLAWNITPEMRQAIQLIISRRTAGHPAPSVSAMLHELRELLHLHPDAAPF